MANNPKARRTKAQREAAARRAAKAKDIARGRSLEARIRAQGGTVGGPRAKKALALAQARAKRPGAVKARIAAGAANLAGARFDRKGKKGAGKGRALTGAERRGIAARVAARGQTSGT